MLNQFGMVLVVLNRSFGGTLNAFVDLPRRIAGYSVGGGSYFHRDSPVWVVNPVCQIKKKGVPAPARFSLLYNFQFNCALMMSTLELKLPTTLFPVSRSR